MLALSIAVAAVVPAVLWMAAQSGDSEAHARSAAVTDIATKADLGRYLFFDPRLSGDAATSCATCHNPGKAWTDGLALSAGYTSNKYFRNTPTLLNAARQNYLFWDGRIDGADLESAVRDHLAEAHFMHVDGRLLVERMLQVPEYSDAFLDLYGSEASYGKVLNALAAFVGALNSSEDNPLMRYRAGDSAALSPQAAAGYVLFDGKAGCSVCHSGELLSDGQFHVTGVPDNPDIFSDPARHITFRRFFKQFAVGDFDDLRSDPGLFALTHDESDSGSFKTPSLLEVAATAPYMHNGMFATLEQVVGFYDAGGGASADRSPGLSPLGLTELEIAGLVAFLESLSSPATVVSAPDLPGYALRPLGGGQ